MTPCCLSLILPPPRRQGRGRLRPGAMLLEQRCDLDAKGCRQTIQHLHRWVFLLSLEAAQVRPIDARVCRQRLLRQATRYPKGAKIPGDELPTVHAWTTEASAAY